MSKTQQTKTDNVGAYQGVCNRTVCRKPNATWYNHSTQKYYCKGCAMLLNRVNPDAVQLFGHQLCTEVINPKPIKNE